MKIILNRCFGGLDATLLGREDIKNAYGEELKKIYPDFNEKDLDIFYEAVVLDRTDPILISLIEKCGTKSKLKIVEVNNDMWSITNNLGIEEIFGQCY